MRVKYSKYKPLSQPKEGVTCLQQAVRDSYECVDQVPVSLKLVQNVERKKLLSFCLIKKQELQQRLKLRALSISDATREGRQWEDLDADPDSADEDGHAQAADGSESAAEGSANTNI